MSGLCGPGTVAGIALGRTSAQCATPQKKAIYGVLPRLEFGDIILDREWDFHDGQHRPVTMGTGSGREFRVVPSGGPVVALKECIDFGEELVPEVMQNGNAFEGRLIGGLEGEDLGAAMVQFLVN